MYDYTRVQVSKLHVYTIQWLTLVEISSLFSHDSYRFIAWNQTVGV